MPRKSRGARSRINNLGSKARKRPIEDVEDEGDQLPGSISLACETSSERTYEEGFVIDEKDGSLTLVGYLSNFEEEPLPDFASDSESDDLESDEEEDDAENYPEIQEPSDLQIFSNILIEAQRIAIEVENERLKESNRPKHHFGNSARTKRRNKRIRKDLEKKGYFSIETWFTNAKMVDKVMEDQNAELDSMITVNEDVSMHESDSVSLIFK